MAYVRKTQDIYCIQTNYGYGWEDESCYDTKIEALRDIDGYIEYTKNYGGSVRIKKRRQKQFFTSDESIDGF